MRDRLQALTVTKLKDLLRSNGLPVSGKKALLVERLCDAGIAPSTSLPPANVVPPKKTTPIVRAARARTGAIIPRDACDRRTLHGDVPTLRVASWNVAGLRGLLKRDAGLASLQHLTQTEKVDVLLLQETKLQTSHVEDVEPQLLEVLRGASRVGWFSGWSCSTARKGYSGTATLWNDRTLGSRAAEATCAPLAVDEAESEAEREGRTLLLSIPTTVDWAGASARGLGIVNVYTPNSGAELKRLGYRVGTSGWDERFRRAVRAPPSAVSHVCVGGDLNVAVADADFFNPGESRMAKQAGTTPEERESMRRFLDPETGFADGFRMLHPNARGQFTYWSQRARNRPQNRGLRLDYFLLSSSLVAADALVDVQHLHQLEGSDHCPILMTLRLDRL
jgi:exodeoxyribonuclease III